MKNRMNTDNKTIVVVHKGRERILFKNLPLKLLSNSRLLSLLYLSMPVKITAAEAALGITSNFFSFIYPAKPEDPV